MHDDYGTCILPLIANATPAVDGTTYVCPECGKEFAIRVYVITEHPMTGEELPEPIVSEGWSAL